MPRIACLLIATLAALYLACSPQPPDLNDPDEAAQHLIQLHLLAAEQTSQFLTLALREDGRDRDPGCAAAYRVFLDGTLALSSALQATPEGKIYRAMFQGIPLDSPEQQTLMLEYVRQHGHETVLGHVNQELALLDAGIAACSELPSTTKDDSGQGAAQILKMLQEYKANPLRAEHLFEGETMVVGGQITAIEEDLVAGAVTILPSDDPNKGHLPRVWLKSGVSLLFASNDARGWLIEKNIGDSIEAECYFRGFRDTGSMDGSLDLIECQQVPE